MPLAESMLALVFRVDANAQMGLGHLLRCQALAQAFVAQHSRVKIHFVIRQASLFACQSRADWCGEVHVLADELSWQDEALWLARFCQQNHIQALVLDGYHFTQAFRQQLATIPVLHVLFDDNNDSGACHCDVLINGASNAASLGYEKSAPGASLLLGDKFRILRPEFSKPAYRLPWHKREQLAIVMGGSDPLNLSIAILQALESSQYRPNIILATGGAYPFDEALKRFLNTTTLDIEHRRNCQNMAEVFGQSKLVISAAGGSQFELLACHTPAILVIVADNQTNATQQAVQQKWCAMLDFSDKQSMPALLTLFASLWASPGRLTAMHKAAIPLADTQGAARVVKGIMQKLGESAE
jgi:UDP-2,4-diacetamido-2,4,6-trideoxy-beta-L-altropyranose hydrolase